MGKHSSLRSASGPHLVVAINASHNGNLLQALIPAVILNQFVLSTVNDYPCYFK